MFHVKHPRFRGFFAWDELGCLSRAAGFPVDLFESNLTNDIQSEENGLPFAELIKMLDYKLLYKATHMTSNLHTADWNTCVLRRCAQILNHKALSFEDMYNARVAYQAYEAGDMKGMMLDQRTLMRTLKMCGKTISPMKLMHRIKHSRDSFDEPGRIQLYELIDLILWAHDGYQTYSPMETYGHFEMEENLFKLADFDQLLSHHDEKLANRLDAQYLKDEWEFSRERLGNKSKFRDPTVICGDSRELIARGQKKRFRHLKSAVGDSQKMVYCCKSGFVRDRPHTAPEISLSQSKQKEYRKMSHAAHNAILHKMQRILKYSESKDPKEKMHVDLSDKPVIKEYKRSATERVVSDEEVVDTAERWDRLMFEIETEAGRHDLHKIDEMDHYIPGYLDKKEEEEEHKKKAARAMRLSGFSKSASSGRRVPQPDRINALAYPVARIPPSHGKRCDARFRGWYDVRSKKGQHYVLVTPFFKNSPNGSLYNKLAKDYSAPVKNIHGNFVHRHSRSSHLSQRPVTAPAVMTMAENQAEVRRNASRFQASSSGYASMDENYHEDVEFPEPFTDQKDDQEQETGNDNVDTHGQPWENNFLKVNKTEDENVTKLSQGYMPDEDQYSESEDLESVETALSDKIKLMASIQDPEVKKNRPRAKSAFTPRNEEIENNEEIDQIKGRSKSAFGNYMFKVSTEEALPVPYMEYSKPRVVSVGSIGKISLLENISESKYWEELTTIKKNEKILEEQTENNASTVSDNENNDENIKQANETKENDLDNKPIKHAKEEEEEDISVEEMIKREDRQRRKKIAMRSYSYMSTALKQMKQKRKQELYRSSERGSATNRLNNSNHNDTSNKEISKPDKTLTRNTYSNSINTRQTQRKSITKSNSVTRNSSQDCKKPRNASSVKKVTVIETNDHIEEEKTKPQKNKYAGLLKRMGEDMPPDMKKKMLNLHESVESLLDFSRSTGVNI